MSKLNEEIQKEIEKLEAEMKDLREQLDYSDANNAGKQVEIAQQIGIRRRKVDSLRRIKNGIGTSAVRHTPGPWNIVRQSNDAGEPSYSIGSEFADGENKHIARVAAAVGWSDLSGKSHRAIRPAEANARLIASAPELLQALIACADELGITPDMECPSPLATMVLFVIDSATGGAE